MFPFRKRHQAPKEPVNRTDCVIHWITMYQQAQQDNLDLALEILSLRSQIVVLTGGEPPIEATWPPQEPPANGQGYVEQPLVVSPSKEHVMTKATATVESLVAALKAEAAEYGVPVSKVNAFLKKHGAVDTAEKHDFTVHATGDTFEEVRDRALRVINTYGATVQPYQFPATVDGVSFTHKVTEV